VDINLSKEGSDILSSMNLMDKIVAQTILSNKGTSKQQKILETAITMFAEKGYANTSTSEIAKMAGVAEGTIFRYYGTKENLLRSVVLPFLKESIPMLATEFLNEIKPQNINTFEEFLKAFISNRLNFIKANKEIFQIVIKELLYREDFRKELLPTFSNEVLATFYKIIEVFKERGELIELPNNTILRMVLSFIGSYFASRFILLPENLFYEDEKEVEIMVSFIMNGVKKPK